MLPVTISEKVQLKTIEIQNYKHKRFETLNFNLGLRTLAVYNSQTKLLTSLNLKKFDRIVSFSKGIALADFIISPHWQNFQREILKLECVV